MSEELQKTPLHAWHIKQGARMVPFSGWDMPVQYTGILEEHAAVREAAGLFDVSHMGEADIQGAQAAAFLDYVCTNKIGNLEVGQARYTILCQPDGGCVDDVIVYRLAEEHFFICLNAANAAKDIAWLKEHVGSFTCTVEDISADWAQLALQGPKAAAILAPLTKTDLKALGSFRFVKADVAGIGVIIARTGYTGEVGFELYVKPEEAEALADALFEAGSAHGLKPAGLGSRDSLRLEAGYPLYGHEISETISPIQAGLGWAVKLNKESDFIGKDTLARQKEGGCSKKIIFFKLNDRRIARAGTPITCGGNIVGEVVSGTHAPTAGCPIGSALVETQATEAPDLAASIRNKDYPLEIVRPPFVKTSLSK